MATDTSSRVNTPAFHADDPDQTIDYRTLSVPAIIGLVFGLASPLCFGAPLLMTIPFFGAIISILALRRITVSDGILAGRWAAVTGLVLCVVFAVAPFSRNLVFRSMRSHQAEVFARQWVNLVLTGQTQQAFRLTVDATRPPAPAEPGAPPPKTSPYDTFMALPTVKALAAAGADSDIRFEGTEGVDFRTSRDVLVHQRYQIVPQSTKSGPDSSAHPVDLGIALERARLGGEGRSRWLVFSTEPPPPPLTTSAAHP